MKQIIRIAMVFLLTMSVTTLYAQQPNKKQAQQPEKQKTEKKEVKGKTEKRNETIRQMGLQNGNVQRIQPGMNNNMKKGKNGNVESLVAEIFPGFGKMVEDKVWNSVLDGNEKLIGYVVFSSPASDGIKGYAGPTPLLIAFDTEKNILAVRMLPNKETPKFLEHVEKSKLLDSWNGLSISKAKSKKVDTVSGATFTSKSVIESFQAILNKL